MRVRLSRTLTDFRPVGIAFAIFLSSNIAVFALVSLFPWMLKWLWLSADRPWGIITSAFTHAELEHLTNNLVGFTFSSVLFVLANAINRPALRRRWAVAFFLLPFIAGIGANAIEYPLVLLRPSNSWGASGVVYGSIGVLLGSSIRNLPIYISAISKERRSSRKCKVRGLSKVFRKSLRNTLYILSPAIAATFLLYIVLDPSGFLSEGPNVDVLAHGFGFLIGFLGSMIYQRSSGKHILKSRRRG